MHISVLVPTYRRPADLERCLAALAAQIRRPDSVVVVCREEDLETKEVLGSCSLGPLLRVVHVVVPGQVAALNSGLAAINGDVVAITDDDAAPRAEWLFRIEYYFRTRPEVGGLGGRDHVHNGKQEAQAAKVGIIQWFGRQIGNHHLGIGVPRYVHMLKGANMSFRMAAIGETRFDDRLRGTGAQVHNDLAFSLAIRRKGWQLLYDPRVAVDHYPAERFDEDMRSHRSLLATSNSAYNETLTLLEHVALPLQPVFLAWALFIGHRDLPGIIRCLTLALTGHRCWPLLPAVFGGRLAALGTRIFPRNGNRQ